MCVRYWIPVRGVCPNYDVVDFQPPTVIPPEPRLCFFLLRIYSFIAPPSIPVVQCPYRGSPPYRPNTPHLIWVFLSHHAVLLCLMICHSGMCIPHKSQWGRGSATSWTTATLNLKWRYMKCLRSLPALCATTGRPVTGHFTSCNTLGKDTRYIDGPPPTSSTPLVREKQMP